ncbi:antibiotic biosynthesis monooxygenase [Couchioplanes caeruleus]|uniref:putative quinol monooxygenase n=1 Tax=Couchioplanes caeruleus TaxID=56438 RepID=UPI0020BF4546|nr:putative quinol monooxygenase [Couchioplanes caeruleus]UQU67032.1 antibiotic biosynthesis monooxygenase [Couchioplanes caeruleus]
MPSYTVIAHYRTTEADARTVREVLSRHAAASAAEPGCVTFTAHQHADDPTRFVLYEVYADEAAFADHRATPHFRDNIEGIVVPLLLERTWTALSKIEPTAPR